MIPARPALTTDRDPRDYHPNRSQVNQSEENVLHPHLGAKKFKIPCGGLGKIGRRGFGLAGSGPPNPMPRDLDESACPSPGKARQGAGPPPSRLPRQSARDPETSGWRTGGRNPTLDIDKS